MLNSIRKALIRSKFKRKGLNVIENIPIDKAQAMLESYEAEGWELAPEFVSFNAFMQQGKCIIRRGQSTLLFEQSNNQDASITGPERIITAIARQLDLSAQAYPSF